jgi:hypothetical protein
MYSGNGELGGGRYEAKYIISEAQAEEIRKYCNAYLPPDPHAGGIHRREYPILSIYLDSAGRDMLRDAVERTRDRVKLRVRTYRSCYGPSDDSPTYLETKRKTNGLVRKQRAPIPTETVDDVLWNGARQSAPELTDATASAHLAHFLELRRRFQADPTVGVFYMREAYQGVTGERIRITFDRKLHFGLLAAPGRGHDRWWPVNVGGVILEIKFTSTYPSWVMQVLHHVEVIRRGVCKYVICSHAAGTPAIGSRGFRSA